MVCLDILERLFRAISREPITFKKLCRSSKIHPKTVRSYLKIIEFVQSQEKIKIEREQFRVIIRKV